MINRVDFREKSDARRANSFAVQRLARAPNMDEDTLRRGAVGIRDLLHGAWTERWVPEILDPEGVDLKLPTDEAGYQDQLERVVAGTNNPSYWVCDTSPQDVLVAPDNVSSMLRVVEYKPRNPFKDSYPNITDIGTRSGMITRRDELQVAALLYFALLDYDSEVEVAHYVEAPNTEDIAFMEEFGFEDTGRKVPKEKIGSRTMEYKHLRAPSVRSVRDNAFRQFPAIGWTIQRKD